MNNEKNRAGRGSALARSNADEITITKTPDEEIAPRPLSEPYGVAGCRREFR